MRIQATTKRDIELDCYRGGALLWVILIHCLYWVGFVPNNNYQSYLLFEMPMFFYIAGASNTLGNKKNIFQFYKSRFARILIPYWVYAAICITISEHTILFMAQPDKVIILNWIIPIENPMSSISYIWWHLWFIPVYLFVMLLFPFYLNLYKRLHSQKLLKYTPFLLFIILIFYFDHFNLDWHYYKLFKQVLFYSFWVYLGIFYSEFKQSPWPRTLIVLTGLITIFLIIFLIFKMQYPINMQSNKFPPNLAFLMLNIGYLCLFSLLKNYIVRLLSLSIINTVIKTFATYGYTIYLYHPFVFLTVMTYISKFNYSQKLLEHQYISTLLLFIVITLISMLLPKFFGWLEKPIKIETNK
ncbi:acyltransferase family protein [Paenibacillus germinis]